MSLNNPYNKYQENNLLTASKEELILMLYDGAIKFGNQAKISLDKKNYEESNRLILRIQNIIQELQLNLDYNYKISANFDLLYDYVKNQLMEANIKKDKLFLENALEIIRSFRVMWKEAILISKKK